jgi:hypothetical protein
MVASALCSGKERRESKGVGEELGTPSRIVGRTTETQGHMAEVGASGAMHGEHMSPKGPTIKHLVRVEVDKFEPHFGIFLLDLDPST